MTSGVVAADSLPGWISTNVLVNVGGGIFTTGLISVTGLMVSAGLEERRRGIEETQRKEEVRAIFRQEADVMRDAVIDGFAVNPEDLARVASPELLDQIATNVMSLRLGDAQFASEIYRDIRDQAIRAPERWHDVEVDLRLSTIVERSTKGAPLFDLTVQWEYTTVPSHTVRRFACVSDRDDYNELRQDIPATSTWFMQPRPGMDPSDRKFYELLELTVDGEPRPIRRSARKSGQVYTVDLGTTADSDTPVRIRQVFRTVTPTWGHRLFAELPQPARNMSVTMDYTNTDIADMRVSDTVATARPVQVSRTPASVPGKVITIDATGWLLPKTGFAFTWTLDSELPRGRERREAA